MSVQLVNGYVLFPNPPDWGDRLRMRREPFDYDDVSGLNDGWGWTGAGHLAGNA